ncbi:MAG: 1-acyl-sn-glycerol-3-phosphate acyltransferase [Candidatus Binatia bacterium]|nr:MAG: 1-acyl-sn-glycerol-3-phosphate acyltransferase [Candidatus Binatia bacterium]
MSTAASRDRIVPLPWWRLAWGLFADLAVAVVTIVLAIPAILVTVVTRRTWAIDFLAPIWSRIVVFLCGVRIEVYGLEHLDPKRSYVIISNHLSNFDIWVTLAALPLRLRFVAKEELLRIPFFGTALRMSDHIVINRSKPDEAVARINERVAAQAKAGKPFCLLFYAEGTRSPDGQVHAFKKGGVTLALRTGLPIVPLSISGTWKLLPKNALLIRPGGRVKLVLAPPIETAGMSLEERDALNERVRAIVIENFDPNV